MKDIKTGDLVKITYNEKRTVNTITVLTPAMVQTSEKESAAEKSAAFEISVKYIDREPHSLL